MHAAELGVFGELWYLQNRAQLQAARLLQGQHRMAGLAETLPERPQQLPAVGVVEGQTTEVMIQEDGHPLGRLGHKHAGLNVTVE